jgi:HEAT repeat protein
MFRSLALVLALVILFPGCQANDSLQESSEEGAPAPEPVKTAPPPVVANEPAPAKEDPEPAKEPKPAASAESKWIAQLGESDAGLRFAAAVELGKAGNLDAVGPLTTTLQEDRDYFVRRAAARSLGELGSDEAVPALIEALDDEEMFVTLTVRKALETITGKRFETADEWSDWWKSTKK